MYTVCKVNVAKDKIKVICIFRKILNSFFDAIQRISHFNIIKVLFYDSLKSLSGQGLVFQD